MKGGISVNKYLFTLTALACCVAFSGCGKESNDDGRGGQGGDFAESMGDDISEDDYDWSKAEKPDNSQMLGATLYYENEPVSLFCIGEGGTVYTYSKEKRAFCEYDAEGKYVKEYPVDGEMIVSVCYQNQRLYYIDTDQLCTMELSSGTTEVLCTFEGNMFAFGRMVGTPDALFIIRKQQYKDEWADVCFEEDDGYVYEGEELLCYHLSANKLIKTDIPNVKQIAKKGDREVFVYAYDGQGGFYFTACDVYGKTGKKQYTGQGLGTILDIAYDSISERLVCTDAKGVFLAGRKNASDKTYMFQGMRQGYNTLQCMDGFTYEIFEVDGAARIVRVENSVFVNEIPALKAYTKNSVYNPPYYGYNISYEEKTSDELALVLLAGDSDFDFIVLDSWDCVSGNIRRIGAYSALDSLDGLDGLLKDCHAYVKEAATAPNGDLWLLPLNVECPVLIYNENRMGEYGLQPASLDTYTEFIGQVAGLPKDGTVLYDVPYYLMTTDITNKYLADYAIKGKKSDFHSDLFHTYLDLMSQYDMRVNSGEKIFSVPGEMHTDGQAEYFSKMLLSMKRSSVVKEDDFFHFGEYDFFHAAPAPNLQEGEKQKAQANMMFLVVNPNSGKRKWVLSYMEEVCKGIHADENSMMLRTNDFDGKPLWQEVQAVVADAVVYFGYPEEIIEEELYRCRMQGQSFEDTVSEMERKMDMYLNE